MTPELLPRGLILNKFKRSCCISVVPSSRPHLQCSNPPLYTLGYLSHTLHSPHSPHSSHSSHTNLVHSTSLTTHYSRTIPVHLHLSSHNTHSYNTKRHILLGLQINLKSYSNQFWFKKKRCAPTPPLPPPLLVLCPKFFCFLK